jgi:anti-sigma factor RsiW
VNQPPGDAELTAYLDGELEPAGRQHVQEWLRRDPDLEARLRALRAGGRPFKAAFEPLLEAAPTQRMQAMLEKLRVPPAEPPRRLIGGFGYRRVAVLLCALVLVFAAGIVVDHLLPSGSPFAESGEWRQAVAEDLALVSQATLAAVPAGSAMRAQELAIVGESLGIDIDPERISLPKAEIRRAQLLEYEGRPVGQIAYLDPEFGPLAFCIMRGDEPPAPLRTERRSGFNIAYWAGDGLAYMLIGRNPAAELEQMARTLADRLPS